jgi:hypothetical protein
MVVVMTQQGTGRIHVDRMHLTHPLIKHRINLPDGQADTGAVTTAAEAVAMMRMATGRIHAGQMRPTLLLVRLPMHLPDGAALDIDTDAAGVTTHTVTAPTPADRTV